MAETPNHGYNVPDEGATDWHVPLNENFEQYDVDIEVRDEAGSRSNYEAREGAKYLATDTGVVSLERGSSWVDSLALMRYRAPDGEGKAGSVVAGHPQNDAADADGATIAGGGATDPDDSGNEVTADYGTVGGGFGNAVDGTAGVIAGGRGNAVGDRFGTVGGGNYNTCDGASAVIGGGQSNTVTHSLGTVAGGDGNTVSAPGATVAGGKDNTARSNHSFVGGGRENVADGHMAVALGGYDNRADGSYAFAAGRSATAEADGAFVWGDSSDEEVTSDQADEFKIQAGGGAVVFSSSDLSAGVTLKEGAGSWASWSTRRAKSDVSPVDAESVLSRVEELPVSTWEYDAEDGATHMGPMAEDFHAAFGLGGDDETIANVDADGVALAAIKGLAERLEEKGERIAELEAAVGDREETIADREDAIVDRDARLEERAARVADLERTVARQRERIDEQAAAIERLEGRLDALEAGSAAAE